MIVIVYKATGKPVKVGDKVSGHRVDKFYAIIEAMQPDRIRLRYNGDVKTHWLPLSVIDAENRPETIA